jgi:long-chain acyl-CoA synthetase
MEEKKLTGYPSIDKPWLKYYSEEAINTPLPECTAYELINRGNAGHPDDIALIYFDRKITYKQLFDEIERAAKAFAVFGVTQGDIVILCMVNMPETIYALYALDRLGAIANLIDPRTNAEQFHNYITECDAKMVVTVDLAYPLIQQAAKETTVERIVAISPADSLSPVKRIAYRLKNKAPALESGDMRWEDFVAHGVNTVPKYAPYERNHCFLIAHTGGTTGIPKGVMLSDDNINAVAHEYQYLDIPFERQHKYFDDLPPFIIYGLTIAIHTTLCYGLQVILYPKFDSKDFPKLFAKYKPNHFSAGADHLKYLAEDPLTRGMNLSFLITAGVGGDTLNAETERTVNEYLKRNGCLYEVVKGYGMTELCATSATSFSGANAIGSWAFHLFQIRSRSLIWIPV